MTRLTGETLARGGIANDVSNWLKFDPIARAGSDPEGVHQLRVTSRRLRAEIDVLGSSLRDASTRTLARDLKWMGSILGRARDSDVLYDLLRRLEGEHVAFDASVLARLERQRERERRRVEEALASERYERLMRELASWAVAPPLRRRSRHSARRLLRPQVLVGLTTLFEQADNLGSAPSDDQLHQLRIAIKHARYRCEIAAPALGEAIAQIAKDLARAQGILGDLHDRAVAVDFLERWQTSRWPADDVPERHEPVDVALERLRGEMSELRRAWKSPLSRARRRRADLYAEADTAGGQLEPAGG